MLKRLIFENNREGFEKLLVHEEAIRVRHTLSKAVFGLEPTADYHKPLGGVPAQEGAHGGIMAATPDIDNDKVMGSLQQFLP